MAETTFHPTEESQDYEYGYPEVRVPKGLVEAVANGWKDPSSSDAYLIDTYGHQLRRRAAEGDVLAASILVANLELQIALDACDKYFADMPF